MTTFAFTIVELLVVVSIILLVSVVSLPSITSLAKSSSRRTAVALAMGAFDQTRGLAISQSATHYLVLADNDSAWPERYRGRAFAIFSEEYIPQQERYVTQLVGSWTPLPDGIVFKPDLEDTLYGAPKEKFYCLPARKELELPCIKFTSVGLVEKPSTAKLAAMRLVEGHLTENGELVITNASKEAAQDTVRISLYTGRAKREEPK